MTRREWRRLAVWIALGVAMTGVSLVHRDVPFCTSWDRGWPWPVMGHLCECAGDERGAFVSMFGIVIDVGFYAVVAACVFGGVAAVFRMRPRTGSRERAPRLR